MGAVYRAYRDDGEFRQQVAIKLVRAAAQSPRTLQRFKQELILARQITDRFEAAEFDVATLVFARFKNLLTQIPTAMQLIPAPVDLLPVEGAGHDLKPAARMGPQILEAILKTAARMVF